MTYFFLLLFVGYGGVEEVGKGKGRGKGNEAMREMGANEWIRWKDYGVGGPGGGVTARM